ncbi:MAG: hypothetical protein ACXWC8_03910 [Limisphaerales bacterium]
MSTTEIIIRENGTIAERTIHERTLKVQKAVLEELSAHVTREIRQAVIVPNWGNAHANVSKDSTVWSIRLGRIPLNTCFGMVGGVLVPKFEAAEMQMPLEWKAPESIRLVFVTETKFQGLKTVIQANWLFAFNDVGNAYRLPLPNLYDDCKLCMGSFTSAHNSAQECLVASLEQFRKSEWNSDLMPSIEDSQRLFRFKPTNETFESLPVDAPDWTDLCEKVSTSLIERVIV